MVASGYIATETRNVILVSSSVGAYRTAPQPRPSAPIQLPSPPEPRVSAPVLRPSGPSPSSTSGATGGLVMRQAV